MGEVEQKMDVNAYLQKTTLSSTSPIVFYDASGNILSEDKVKYYSDKVLDLMISDLNRKPDLGKSSIILRHLTDIKKTWYPATQKQINTNVNLFDKHLKDWIDARKQLPNHNEEQIVIEINQAEKEVEVSQ